MSEQNHFVDHVVIKVNSTRPKHDKNLDF